jgi:hypothetical protein
LPRYCIARPFQSLYEIVTLSRSILILTGVRFTHAVVLWPPSPDAISVIEPAYDPSWPIDGCCGVGPDGFCCGVARSGGGAAVAGGRAASKRPDCWDEPALCDGSHAAMATPAKNDAPSSTDLQTLSMRHLPGFLALSVDGLC